MIEPGTPEWQSVITPSKVPAILGVSKYDSPFRCWHRMAGNVAGEPPKPEFDRGHDLEPAMALMWRRLHPGWQLSPGEVQMISGGADRFGFPYVCTLDRRARRGRARRVVQFKTCRDLDDWGELDTDEAPPYVVAQVITEMAFSGYTAHPASVMVLGPYFDARCYTIAWQPSLWVKILARLREWHVSLKLGEPPELDDSVATYDALRQLHPDIEPGAEVHLEPADVARLRLVHANAIEAERQLQAERNQLAALMGSAQFAMCGGEKIARRQGSKSVSLVIVKPKPGAVEGDR
jgi:hypothetical protein